MKPQTNETRERQHAHHASHYLAYHDEMHAEINQAKRLVRHLRAHPGDVCAMAALRALPQRVLDAVPDAVKLSQGAVV